MSREPTSSQMRLAMSRGGWDSGRKPEPPPPALPTKKRKLQVVVELAKPQPVRRSRHADERANFQRTVTKLTTTTEALTPDERRIIQGYRLSVGGPAADEVRRQIEEEVRRS